MINIIFKQQQQQIRESHTRLIFDDDENSFIPHVHFTHTHRYTTPTFMLYTHTHRQTRILNFAIYRHAFLSIEKWNDSFDFFFYHTHTHTHDAIDTYESNFFCFLAERFFFFSSVFLPEKTFTFIVCVCVCVCMPQKK